MHTNGLLSRSINVAAPPAAVLGLIGDPAGLPRWAPRFAEGARPPTGDRWSITADGAEFEIRVLSAHEAGTVDFLAPEEDRGLFARVVPSGDVSAVTFTRAMPATTPAAVVAEQQAVLEQELEARGRCARADARRAARALPRPGGHPRRSSCSTTPTCRVFKVAGKLFAIGKLVAEPLQVSVKCDPGQSEQLRRDQAGMAPATRATGSRSRPAATSNPR